MWSATMALENTIMPDLLGQICWILLRIACAEELAHQLQPACMSLSLLRYPTVPTFFRWKDRCPYPHPNYYWKSKSARLHSHFLTSHRDLWHALLFDRGILRSSLLADLTLRNRWLACVAVPVEVRIRQVEVCRNLSCYGRTFVHNQCRNLLDG